MQLDASVGPCGRRPRRSSGCDCMSESLIVNPESPEAHLLDRACAALRRGDVVAYPTDTLYGLAADPSNPEAVVRLARVKMRPSDRAIPLIAADVGQVEALTGPLSGAAARLAERWWPGPLTLVLPCVRELAPGVCGPANSVAIRVPAHPIARALAARFGVALTSTSANRSGEPAPMRATEISPAVVAEVVIVVDGGRTAGGDPSTIVDPTGPRVALLRAGAIPWGRVLESLDV